jgi:hypothetical protein
MSVMSMDEAVAPDTKDAEQWQEVLRRSDVRRRPEPSVWSPLEYGCHVRDVHHTMTRRVRLMLEQDEPTFANWD